MNEIETWKPIPGYEGDYEVSTLGRVRSLERMVPGKVTKRVQAARLMRGFVLPNGYKQVPLRKDGKTRKHYVHRLVLTAFVGPRPAGMYAFRNDTDRANNRLDNLRWDTQ